MANGNLNRTKEIGHLNGVVVDALLGSCGGVGDAGCPLARRTRRRDGGPSPARRVMREAHKSGCPSGGGRGEPRGGRGGGGVRGREEASERGSHVARGAGTARGEQRARERDVGSGRVGTRGRAAEQGVLRWRIKAVGGDARWTGGGEGWLGAWRRQIGLRRFWLRVVSAGIV